MSMIKGQVKYEKFKKGEKLSRREAMLAMCYSCNGFEESNEDCQGKSCPIYPFQPYKGKRRAEEGSFMDTTIKGK